MNIPEPLRGSEIPSFTNYSIVVRLPDIARRTLSENDFAPQVVAAIETLIAEIPDAVIRPVNLPLAPDADQWREYTMPYTGQNWLQVPWFFAEEYFYARILEASGYFHPGPGQGKDPYAHQKRLGLETTRREIKTLAAQIQEIPDLATIVERLLLIDLWGNQNDLSLWPASHDPAEVEEERAELREAREHILADDSRAALDYLLALTPGAARIDFLIDNAGYELVCDLALADVLLASGFAAQVVFHLKSQPVFVSDALVKDVKDTLNFLEGMGGDALALAVRLRSHGKSGAFRLQPDPFWTSPLAMWDMPNHVQAELAQSHLMISKGDANYRRLLGDRHWPLDKPFAQVVSSYLPCPALALRTLKSEIAVGLDTATLPTHDKDWMSNGRWGLIQFSQSRV